VSVRLNGLGALPAPYARRDGLGTDAQSARKAPLQRSEGFFPFFLVGSGRSGSTLLRRMLYAHPALHIPPETYVLGEVIELFEQARKLLSWRDLVCLVLARFEYHREFETFETSLRPLAQRLVALPERRRTLATILDGLYRHHAAAQSRRHTVRWGDKTPLNTFHLDAIHRVFPDAQFVHVLRDGVDVSYSYVSASLYPDIQAAARRWRDSLRAARRFMALHPAACLEIRYEELATQPEATLRRLCAFLRISYRPAMLQSEAVAAELGDVPRRRHHRGVRRPIFSSSIGRGRTNVSATERRALDRLIGRDLQHAGYPPCFSE
jgi:LPS sulfotransferase NodH